MAIETNFRQFEQFADVIGPAAALRLCAWFGGDGRALYVPTEAKAGHILQKILGYDAFCKLVAAFSGQGISVPTLDLQPLRNAGRIYAMTRRGLSCSMQAHLIGLTPERVRQVQRQLYLEGYPGLAAELDEDDCHAA